MCNATSVSWHLRRTRERITGTTNKICGNTCKTLGDDCNFDYFKDNANAPCSFFNSKDAVPPNIRPCYNCDANGEFCTVRRLFLVLLV